MEHLRTCRWSRGIGIVDGGMDDARPIGDNVLCRAGLPQEAASNQRADRSVELLQNSGHTFLLNANPQQGPEHRPPSLACPRESARLNEGASCNRPHHRACSVMQRNLRCGPPGVRIQHRVSTVGGGEKRAVYDGSLARLNPRAHRPAPEVPLDSWKEIATYLKRD